MLVAADSWHGTKVSTKTDTWSCIFRDARLNAKINSAEGTVVMGTVFQTAYEQNLENAKSLSERTFMLANAVGIGSRAA